MGKLFIRLSIILVSIYMILCYSVCLIWDINLWSHTYVVLFEICVCLCLTAQGTYHCKFIKWTAYGITLSDALVSIDELFDIFPYTIIVFLPLLLTILGLSTTTFLAVRHYIRIKRLKRIWNIPKEKQTLR